MTCQGDLDAAELLRRHGLRPRHRLGQSFLQDRDALSKITAAADLGREDTVLEIGAGFGSLTARLAEAAGNVVAVELDPKLVAIAADYLGPRRNVRLICGDILALAPADLGLPAGYIAAANIPYYVTSPILRHLLESDPRPRRIVLTVQAEVAARICAAPPNMSLLALSVQVYGKPTLVTKIPAEAFFPPPKVASAVVRIDAYEAPLVPAALLPQVFRLAKAGFLHRRKTLRNSLASGLKIPLDASGSLLRAAHIDPQRRAQSLDLRDWEMLASEAEARRS